MNERIPANLSVPFWLIVAASCSNSNSSYVTNDAVEPAVVTEKVRYDSDDPAIYIDPADTSNVLIIGTDKGGDSGEGALYAFDLNGKIVRAVQPLKRPNNVDIAYGLRVNDSTTVDIAVCTERYSNAIRVFSLPDLKPIDNGGIPVFEGEDQRDPMGIALLTQEPDHSIYAIVGRKTGPLEGGYLAQYKLEVEPSGNLTGTFVRKFGLFSGRNEIEAIAVDNELGYVYYSDEGIGVRKYYAHPDSSDRELALFAARGFRQDHEGISIYKNNDGTGYILVSDQQANAFHVFPREGTTTSPHDHPVLAVIPLLTNESDGSDVSSVSLPNFPRGLFVAMSDDGTFQYYRWEDLEEIILSTHPAHPE